MFKRRTLTLCSLGFLLVFANVVHARALFQDDFYLGSARSEWGDERGNWVVMRDHYLASRPSNNPPTYTSITSLPELRNFIVDVDIINVRDGGIWLRSHRCANGQVAGVLLVTGGKGGTYNGLYWHIWTCNGWGPVYRAVSIPRLQGSNIHLTLVVQGDTYKAYRANGFTLDLVTTLITNQYFSGRVALYSNSAQYFDNVSVEVLPIE